MENKLEAFKEGQLCYVVLRPYKGKGEPVLILHEAIVLDADPNSGFYYGSGRAWTAPAEIGHYHEPVVTPEGESKDEEETKIP